MKFFFCFYSVWLAFSVCLLSLTQNKGKTTHIQANRETDKHKIIINDGHKIRSRLLTMQHVTERMDRQTDKSNAIFYARQHQTRRLNNNNKNSQQQHFKRFFISLLWRPIFGLALILAYNSSTQPTSQPANLFHGQVCQAK